MMVRSSLYSAGAAALSALLLPQAAAFAFAPSRSIQQNNRPRAAAELASSLRSAATDEIPSDAALDAPSSSGGDPESVLQGRNRLLALSKTLASNSPSGRFITRPSDKVKLQRAVADLEAMAPSSGDVDRAMMLGDWTLVATANLPSSDIRRRLDERKNGKSKSGDGGNRGGWFKSNGKRRSGLSLFGGDGAELNPIQKSIQKTIEVTQRIRDDMSGSSTGVIDRVDNVIEYTPLDTLEDIIPESSPLYNLLGSVNVNPLKVKKSKVVLVHKAEVESSEPVLRTKIAWTSSVRE